MTQHKILTVRVSSLPRYNDCGRAVAMRFIRKEIEAEGHELRESQPSIAAAIGTGVHAMMAELFKHKLAGLPMDLEAAFDAREEVFRLEVGKGALWDLTTPHMDAAKAQLKALCNAFLPIARLTDPENVEDELSYECSPLGNHTGTKIKLIGHRDVRDKRREIHDHKTGSADEIPPCHAQLGGYAMLSEWNNQPVSAVRVNFAPRLKLGHLHEIKVRSVRLDLDTCIAEAWSTLRLIQGHYERWLETKQPESFPANPYSQSCTEKYCGAYGTTFCKVGKCE